MPSFPSTPTTAPSNGASRDFDFVQRLMHHIEQHGTITFAEYMGWVLYQADGGYYSEARGLGPQGDFVTSSHLCADFGELLAVQFAEMWQILGCPQPFQLIEMGAGQGILAADVMRSLAQDFPDCFAALDYGIIEKSSRLKRYQNALFQTWKLPQKPRWLDWDDIPHNSVVGCFFSNELVDALPVHLVEVSDGALQEVYVQVNQDSAPGRPFVETLAAPSTPALQTYFDDLNIDLSHYPNGYRTEVNLAAKDWLQTLSQRLQRGYCLSIDYGYSADRYYLPSRTEGTLQAYYQHSHHNDPYINIGEQDLTAHVNFTALEQWGEALGLKTIDFTKQALLLMALGLGDRLTALASDATDMASIQHAIQRREVLHQLMNPIGLGGFGALVQGKGLTSDEVQQPLRGWTVPPMTM